MSPFLIATLLLRLFRNLIISMVLKFFRYALNPSHFILCDVNSCFANEITGEHFPVLMLFIC